MSKQDDRLEEKLSALEEGGQPEEIMRGSSNSSGLKPLVNLAASLRNLPHPEQDQRTVQTEKRRIISAAREKYRGSQNTESTKTDRFTGLWLFVPAVAGVALILLMVFVLAAGVGLYFSGPRGAHAATLVGATGVLEVSDSGFAGDWYQIASGDKVRSGQRLRTGDESWVTLEFFDGSQMTLAPNTDLVLNKVDGNWGDELQVELIQNQGETNHQVVPLQGEEATYQVFTPSGEASVRGTAFNVLVEDTGISLFTVEAGEVLVSNDGFETNLAAGQGVVTELGVEIASPSYLFTLQGVLKDNTGKTWQVENVKFTVKGGTSIVGNPQETDYVEVHGRIKKNGEWVADTITRLGASVLPEGTLTGVVTSKDPDSLSIGRYSFAIVGPIPDAAVGDLVRVTFTIVGEVWTIKTLEILEGVRVPDQEDDSDEDAESEPDMDEVLYFSDEEFEDTDCIPVVDSKREFTTTLNYVPQGEDLQQLEVELTLLDNLGELESGLVDSITIMLDGVIVVPPYKFTLLPDSDPIQLVVTVTLGTDRLPPKTKLEIQVVVTEVVTDATISEPLSTTFKIEWECDEEIPENDLPGDGDKCTRAEPHPKPIKLAEAYVDRVGATYDANWIWDMFCTTNLGFGEIELAFKLYLDYQKILDDTWTIERILGMRLGTGLDGKGLGWGQIRHAMADAENALQTDAELTSEEGKKEPPGKQKSEDAKNKEKPNKKNKNDD
jgi:hypothetical protein